MKKFKVNHLNPHKHTYPKIYFIASKNTDDSELLNISYSSLGLNL